MKEIFIELILAAALAIIAAILYETIHEEPATLSIILFISSAIVLAVMFYRIFTKVREKIHRERNSFSFLGKSSKLKPEVLLGPRPYNEFYFLRENDEKIKEAIEKEEHALIIGRPLSGKTRAAFEAIRNLKEEKNTAILLCRDITIDTFTIPKKTKIIVIDDLHRFVEQQNFEHVFREATERNLCIVATCRSGKEYEIAKNKMAEKNYYLGTVFNPNIIEIPRIESNTAHEIADRVYINWDDIKFDGTIGSLFLLLEEMRRRFDNCSNTEKTILRVIKKMYICGIDDDNTYSLGVIQLISNGEGLEANHYQWNEWLERLKANELLKLHDQIVVVEEVYLEDVVSFYSDDSAINIFKEILNTLTQSQFPELLFKLGNRANNIAEVDLKKLNYSKIAISSYEEALKVYTIDRFPMDYAMTHNNLGYAYRVLAEVEEKSENCKKAISSFEEALKVYTIDRFPMQYAIIRNNLDIAIEYCHG